jgi:formylglycine-generating enzyme required for sulfatase activity
MKLPTHVNPFLLPRIPPRRELTAALAACLLGALLAGCGESKSCPPAPDAGVAGDPDLGADLPRTCRQHEAECGTDEINAFGICLTAATMAKIPAGEFTMGRTEEGKPYSPEHRVSVKEFLIDQTEVPVRHYKACVDCGACEPPLRDGSHTGREPYYGNEDYNYHPVIYVRWDDAKAYCEGIGKRLPTEAEWEKAARGADAAEFPWGADSPNKDRANFYGVRNDTDPVESHEAGKSSHGLFNMAGNVWEWVEDTYDPSYYDGSPASDPPGPDPAVIKVMRGGGFMSSPDQLKTYFRAGEVGTAAFSYVGFRCAMDAW